MFPRVLIRVLLVGYYPVPLVLDLEPFLIRDMRMAHYQFSQFVSETFPGLAGRYLGRGLFSLFHCVTSFPINDRNLSASILSESCSRGLSSG